MTTVFRVHWTPGTDRLVAVCHCSSWCEVDDPVAAWEWLLAHPDGHHGGAGPPAGRDRDGRRRPVPTRTPSPEVVGHDLT
jgi:hypothetical protein